MDLIYIQPYISILYIQILYISEGKVYILVVVHSYIYCLLICVFDVALDAFTHSQFVVKSFDLYDQAVFTGHQFILQLGHFSFVGRLCQVVAKDVDQQVKQDHTGRYRI